MREPKGVRMGSSAGPACPDASGSPSILEAWRFLPLGGEGTSPVRVLSLASREKGKRESPSCLPFSQALSAQNIPDAGALRAGWCVLNLATLMDSTPRAHCLQTSTRGPHEMRWPHRGNVTLLVPSALNPGGYRPQPPMWGGPGRGGGVLTWAGTQSSRDPEPSSSLDTVTPGVWANRSPYKRLSLR